MIQISDAFIINDRDSESPYLRAAPVTSTIRRLKIAPLPNGRGGNARDRRRHRRAGYSIKYKPTDFTGALLRNMGEDLREQHDRMIWMGMGADTVRCAADYDPGESVWDENGER